MIDDILAAMRADCVPTGESGRWTVSRREITPAQAVTYSRLERKGMCRSVPAVTYTWLHCLTAETRMNFPGETVMNDFPCELRKHLEFIMLARGRVLVGGLGLGCVVRGLLARGAVESIDVVERSEDVIKLCAASVSDPRVTLHQRDMRSGFLRGGPWDFAWLDLWNDPEKSEPHLQVIHIDLMKQLMDRVGKIGAWAFPRRFRRSLRRTGSII